MLRQRGVHREGISQADKLISHTFLMDSLFGIHDDGMNVLVIKALQTCPLAQTCHGRTLYTYLGSILESIACLLSIYL